MQAHRTISKHTSARSADAEMQLGVYNQQVATLEYKLPDLSLLLLFILRKSVPYAPQPVTNKASYELCKRVLDIAGSLVLLVITVPLFAAIVILIRIDSPGPVFFKQKRPGRAGKEFWCYKFRTMVADAEDQLKCRMDLCHQLNSIGKIKKDPRVTSVGMLLRKSSLDELPQLFNVLMGDMSLIGPRPILPSQFTQYGVYGNKLFSVKPGIGGLWQASGRSDLSFAERVHLDILYIDVRSLWLDILLLILTALAVFKGRGAY